MDRENEIVSTVSGAAVTCITSPLWFFLPVIGMLGPFGGGTVAGFLYDGDRRTSVTLGALSGSFVAMVTLLPVVFLIVTDRASIDSVLPGGSSVGSTFVSIAVVLVILSTAGGFLGWYVRAR